MSDTLVISDLSVNLKDRKNILQHISIKINAGDIHVLLGPNGSGKTSLGLTLMGHPDYLVSSGKIFLNQKNITHLPPDLRSKLGLFLGFQSPVEVPGVNLAGFLRLAINAGKKQLVSPLAFRQQFSKIAADLKFSPDITSRSVNFGFSGGEKKKSEILQLLLLKPKFVILDEPDSGLDIDSVKLVSHALAGLDPHPGVLLITHQSELIRYLKPTIVHLMVGGCIVKSGSVDLAKDIATHGYAGYQK